MTTQVEFLYHFKVCLYCFEVIGFLPFLKIKKLENEEKITIEMLT